VSGAAIEHQYMNNFVRALMDHSLSILAAGLILAFSSIAGLSAENCQRLETLAAQYAGVALTVEQKRLKRKMVAWYSTHCIRHARR
jgi:hypothetical protein